MSCILAQVSKTKEEGGVAERGISTLLENNERGMRRGRMRIEYLSAHKF